MCAATITWKKPYTPGAVCFRIEVEGDHNFMLEFTTTPGKDLAAYRNPNEALSGKSTAMPLVNAIPAVCRASPGLLGPRNVPYAGVRNVRTPEA